MSKYVVEFSKTGIMCYISHLDMMRLFNRIFKKTNIKLAYSKGFNPHPKMGFAQPLSLGYIGLNEMMEFETKDDHCPQEIMTAISKALPDGIEIKKCKRADELSKTLAALTKAAEYEVIIPLDKRIDMTDEEIKKSYIGQDKIIAIKRKKKSREAVETDIKPMIKKVVFQQKNETSNPYKYPIYTLVVKMVIDSGSVSNLSPELVIETIKARFDIKTDRSAIDVIRGKIDTGFDL